MKVRVDCRRGEEREVGAKSKPTQDSGGKPHLDILQPHHQVPEGLIVCGAECLRPGIAQGLQQRLVRRRRHVISSGELSGCVCEGVLEESKRDW